MHLMTPWEKTGGALLLVACGAALLLAACKPLLTKWPRVFLLTVFAFAGLGFLVLARNDISILEKIALLLGLVAVAYGVGVLDRLGSGWK